MAQCSRGMNCCGTPPPQHGHFCIYATSTSPTQSESLACNDFRLLPEGRGNSSELDCGNALLEALFRALEHQDSVRPLPAPIPELEDDCCLSRALPAELCTGTSELSEADFAQCLRELPPGLCSTTPEPSSES